MISIIIDQSSLFVDHQIENCAGQSTKSIQQEKTSYHPYLFVQNFLRSKVVMKAWLTILVDELNMNYDKDTATSFENPSSVLCKVLSQHDLANPSGLMLMKSWCLALTATTRLEMGLFEARGVIWAAYNDDFLVAVSHFLCCGIVLDRKGDI